MDGKHWKVRIASACVLAIAASRVVAAPFTFEDIEYWVGSGANRAALVIDWDDNSIETPALAWGFCWDGTAHGNANGHDKPVDDSGSGA